MKTLAELRADALAIFYAGLQAADPYAAMRRVLKREADTLSVGDQHYDLSRTGVRGHGRIFVVGAGKAGAPMARAAEDVLDDYLTAGAVTVKYGHVGETPFGKIKLNEAGHPLPDENGVRATREILELLRGLTPDDLVICLISGGGSALLELLVEGVTLDDLRALTQALLRSGATINEINTLRKHLSQVKGGQLARLAQPATVVSLILSDVLGSPLDVIASGPTAPDSTTFADALAVNEEYKLSAKVPSAILGHLEHGARGEIPDTPKADDPLFARVMNIIIADNTSACEAAASEAQTRGYSTSIFSTQIQGGARGIGGELASWAQGIYMQRQNWAQQDEAVIWEQMLKNAEYLVAQWKERGEPLPEEWMDLEALARDLKRATVEYMMQPACLLMGGETTVVVRGSGLGGRAQELALAAAPDIAGDDPIVILSAGTDGNDGPTDAAGALADNTTLTRAEALGLDAEKFLEDNDSYHFFQALDDLIITGPTNTNVNDLMLALVG